MNNINNIYFNRFPSKYIKTNIYDEYGLNYMFYIVYICIDRYRTIENYSWISVLDIFNCCGYEHNERKCKHFKNVISVLKYMQENKMIILVDNVNLDKLFFKEALKIKINTDLFDSNNSFVELKSDIIDKILSSKTKIDKNYLFETYLFMKHKMFNVLENGFFMAFFKKEDIIHSSTIVPKYIFKECINELINLNLIIKDKYYTRSAFKGSITNNIYVLNDEKANENIRIAKNILESRRLIK